jgi:hypothetical protein
LFVFIFVILFYSFILFLFFFFFDFAGEAKLDNAVAAPLPPFSLAFLQLQATKQQPHFTISKSQPSP